jgi:deoxycytidylate deaminase
MSSTLSGITGGGSSCGVTEKTCPVCLGEGRIFGCPRRAAGFGSGEGLHLCPAAHAEANAIAQAALLGIPVLGATLYMNFKTPCKDCLGILINAGIAEVVCTDPSHYDELSKFLLEHSSIKVRGFAEEGQQNDSDQAELGVDKGARGRYIKIH